MKIPNFEFMPHQTLLLTSEMKPVAPNLLSVGSFRAGFTWGWLAYLVQYYCLEHPQLNALVFTLDQRHNAEVIKDFMRLVPEVMYHFDSQTNIATFHNGASITFRHQAITDYTGLQWMSDAQLKQFVAESIEDILGNAWPAIFVEQCGSMRPELWEVLKTRNCVNPKCKQDVNGNLPMPFMVGTTYPIGAFYEYYRHLFFEKCPYPLEPDMLALPASGAWLKKSADGDYRIIYESKDYAAQRGSVRENTALLKRDPQWIVRLERSGLSAQELRMMIDGRDRNGK